MLARTFVALLFVLLSLLPASPLHAQTTEHFTKLKELAEQGNPDAQGLLGDLYRKAAEQGLAYAQVQLSALYYAGRGVPQDYVESEKWARKAAEQGDASGQDMLGALYYNGKGVPLDYTEAERLFRKAAKQGNTDAQVRLGRMYFTGTGVPQDYTEAEKWYRKAAEQGDASGQFFLGGLYNDGKGVPQDNEEAYFWFNLAAVTGNKAFTEVRNLTAEILSPESRSAAQRRAREWKPTAPAAQGKQ